MNKYFTVGLIFLFGITISVIIFLTVKHQLNIHKNLEFNWTTSEHFRALHKQLNEDIYSLESHKTLNIFQLDKKNDFLKFSKHTLNQHKSIHSLYWLPGNVIKDFKNNSNLKTKLGSLILYSEPADANFFALNEVHDFDSNFQKILEQTRDTGQLLIREISSANNGEYFQNGIIILSPVYKPEQSITFVEQRKQNLIGFVMGVLLFKDLFDLSIGHLEPRGIDIYLLNNVGKKIEKLLYHYRSRLSRSDDSTNQNTDNYFIDDTLNLSKSFTITDQNWLFIGKETPEFRSSEAFNQGPAIALLTGVVFTIFIVFYFYNLSNAKDAWQTAEKKLHTVLDNSPDYIIILDKISDISYMNKPLFGLETTASIGQNLFDWLPTEYHKRYKKGLIKAFDEEKADFFNYSLADFSHWEVRILPIRTKNKVSSAMVINTDISEQHKLQIQTMENSRLASIGVLATGIAHEINNPNNSIYYNASFIQDSWSDILPILDEYKEDNGDFSMGGLPFSDTREKFINASINIIDHTSRIKKIVESLKSFARKDSGELNEDVQVIDVISNALLIINNEVSKYTDHLSLDLPNNLPQVKANAQKLEQVFINIVLNALHALTNKDNKIFISARYDENQKTIIISVQDEGIGIDESCIDKITQPFYTTKPNHIGTGLGLSISNSIIKELKGKLLITSKLNKGTKVSISIPVTKTMVNNN
ncbi:MAG: ATP-binding protein [Aureibaculum sp.]|nr:ATP-binding protein [Aureibaculum sp.]